MVTRKQPRPRSIVEQVVWLIGYGVSLHALLLKHDGKMSAPGSAHMAAERADEGVMHFYERFPK
jgi:hypothetical protein